MSVKQRLTKFAKSQEKSVRAFEINAGLTIGYVNSIRVSIQPDKLQRIASHYPNLNTGWLLTGEGDMIKKPEPPFGAPAQNVSDAVSMPREVWDAMAARDRRIDELLDRMKVKDGQVDRMIAKIDARDEKIDDVIAMLKEQIKKRGAVSESRGML